jgi:hypothetical protein
MNGSVSAVILAVAILLCSIAYMYFNILFGFQWGRTGSDGWKVKGEMHWHIGGRALDVRDQCVCLCLEGNGST